MRGLTSCAILLLGFISAAPAGDEIYQLGSESQRHEGVPQAQVTEHVWKSTSFPDTIRRYWVYIPAQYDGSEPAAVMVFQDGHAYVSEEGQFRVPVVLDNLIHAGGLPVIVAIFIDPGHQKETLPEKPGWSPRPENRSFEYDSLTDAYVRFLLEEALPAALDGLDVSTDPADRKPAPAEACRPRMQKFSNDHS